MLPTLRADEHRCRDCGKRIWLWWIVQNGAKMKTQPIYVKHEGGRCAAVSTTETTEEGT